MESRFDFVVFDWKGTLEKKGGNKKIRIAKSLDAVKKELSSMGHDPLHFEATYKKKTAELKLQESEHLVNVSIKERMDMVFDMCNINHSVHRTRLFNTWVRTYMDLDSNKDSSSTSSASTKKESGMLEGWDKILKTLEENGIPFCLLRNSSLTGEEFQKKIDSKGAGRFFHHSRNVVLSGEVGFVKPHPNAFKATLEKVGLEALHSSHPRRILFVGNETQADVVGSNNMGWTSVLIRTTEQSSNGLAHFEIDSLLQLKQVIFGHHYQDSDDSDDSDDSEDDSEEEDEE